MPWAGTLACFGAASVAAIGIGASLDSPRSLMARPDYNAALKTIESQTRLRLGECRSLADVARPKCRAAAWADERVRRAELDARYLGTFEARAALVAAKARALPPNSPGYLKL